MNPFTLLTTQTSGFFFAPSLFLLFSPFFFHPSLTASDQQVLLRRRAARGRVPHDEGPRRRGARPALPRAGAGPRAAALAADVRRGEGVRRVCAEGARDLVEKGG